ncbi:MAG: hypothetical protein IKK43_00345 [Clostridia bacterium]|nr:hypothetical protein [Clostridia bacterium]
MKKSILITIAIIAAIVLSIFGAYLIDMNCMENNKPVVFSTWGYDYAPPVGIDEIINVSKEEMIINEKQAIYDVNNDYLNLTIPDDWEFEIITDFTNSMYRCGLKIYPKNSETYMNVYCANRFGVCGTGLKVEKINLDNGIEVEVGYYNDNENWEYAYFEDGESKIAAWNSGLVGENANAALEILKTVKYNKNK